MYADKMVEGYRFRLRMDMPHEYKENKTYPELPAIYEFLSQFDEHQFENLALFDSALESLGEHFEKNKTNVSSDTELWEGLRREPFERGTYKVITPTCVGKAGEYVFGFIGTDEEIKELFNDLYEMDIEIPAEIT